MLGALPRRLIESVVGLFALLGFFYVPLGKLTGFEHLKAIACTPAATHAAEEVVQAMLRVRARMFAAFAGNETESASDDGSEARNTRPVPRGVTPRAPRLRAGSGTNLK